MRFILCSMLAEFTTRSGRVLDFSNPLPNAIHLDDILCGLSNICRFSGQCRVFYSVLDHSINVCRSFDGYSRELRSMALLHDATEAYMGDIPHPLKAYMRGGPGSYSALENRLLATIFERFSLPTDFGRVWERVLREDELWGMRERHALLLLEKNAVVPVRSRRRAMKDAKRLCRDLLLI